MSSEFIRVCPNCGSDKVLAYSKIKDKFDLKNDKSGQIMYWYDKNEDKICFSFDYLHQREAAMKLMKEFYLCHDCGYYGKCDVVDKNIATENYEKGHSERVAHKHLHVVKPKTFFGKFFFFFIGVLILVGLVFLFVFLGVIAAIIFAVSFVIALIVFIIKKIFLFIRKK